MKITKRLVRKPVPDAALHSPAARRAFARRLLSWYERHRRTLPWRDGRDAYEIWVSEVMLQQTRVAAVLAYYLPFLRQFPTVRALATAKQETVLAAWSGLGYYRRARALQAAAKAIVDEHGGELPRTAVDLQNLPGFGPYTAAAVASIAFGEPVAVVDGNVERVLARLLGWQKPNRRQASAAAQQLLTPARPGDFNQAMMELGATVCLPQAPLCASCPVSRWCKTRGLGPAKPSALRQHRQAHYRVARRGAAVFLVQRGCELPLMPGMWELPEIAVNGTGPEVSFRLRHSITFTDFSVEVSLGDPPADIRGRWFTRTQLQALPLTGLARKILQRINFI